MNGKFKVRTRHLPRWVKGVRSSSLGISTDTSEDPGEAAVFRDILWGAFFRSHPGLYEIVPEPGPALPTAVGVGDDGATFHDVATGQAVPPEVTPELMAEIVRRYNHFPNLLESLSGEPQGEAAK